ADSPLKASTAEGGTRFLLREEKVGNNRTATYFLRFPQDGQEASKVKDRLGDRDDLLREARAFWLAWKPVEGKVVWSLPDFYGDFYTASVRNMVEAREIKEGKKIFQVGPTVYRGLWYIDGVSLLEAARYAGFDKEAQE